LESTHLSTALLIGIALLVALLTVAPSLCLASDLGHADLSGKRTLHGGWLGKLPWASQSNAFSPSLLPIGSAPFVERLERLPLIADAAFVPPRR